MDQNQAVDHFQLISPAFAEGAEISAQYTCRGDNVSPPLVISGVPKGAKSLVLIMHDPDAVRVAGIDFVHWLMWDIPSSTETINASSVPVGAVQGPNSSAQKGYTGPCPPAGTGVHHYLFELYALDTALTLPPDTNRQKLEAAMDGHIIGRHTLTGIVNAD